MNEYLAKIKENGELAALHEKWASFKDNEGETLTLPTGGKTLVFATCGDTYPYSAVINGETTGYDDVSTRVFYMDQGEIYEDGTPEQIFENPQKERTRRFILHLKVLDETIVSRNFDFLAVTGRIEEFGRKHMMEQRSILAAETIFEEMCVQTILPRLGKNPNVRYTLEYSEQSGESTLLLRWNGEKFDPLTEGEELSVLLATNSASEIRYTRTEEEDYPNRLFAKLR